MICIKCGQEIKKSVQHDAYTLALKELGTKEIPGKAHNERVLEYHKATSLRATTDEVPWCASFVCWSLESVGLPSTRSASARSYLQWGEKIDSPMEGDICVLWRGRIDASTGHVGFFVKFEGNDVVLLGGNQSDAVSIERYPRSRVLAFRRWK